MPTKIITKNGSGVPAGGALDQGELAVDLTNKKLYSSTDGTDVVEIAEVGAFDDGSNSAPSVSFTNASDGGLFRFSGSNSWGMATGGACVIAMNALSGVMFTGGQNTASPSASSGYIWCRANSLAGMLIYGANSPFGFYNTSGTQVGSISQNGSSTSYNTSSDYRLKEDVQPMTLAIERIKQITPVNFRWIESQERTDGFIAHELANVVPEAVTGEKDGMTEDPQTGELVPEYQGIDQAKLVPLLVAAVQELTARIEALETP